MKYKKGDKVVVEITEVDEKDKELTYGVGNPTWIRSKYILGKLEDFAKPKKIKFSEAEKKEFDDIRSRTKELFKALEVIAKIGTGYPHLKNWIKEDNYPLYRNRREILFAKAWERPELIEVEKEKRYYIRILGQYLDYNFDKNVLYLHEIKKMVFGQNTFTQTEIDKLQKLSEFSAIDLNQCKEAVEDE